MVLEEGVEKENETEARREKMILKGKYETSRKRKKLIQKRSRKRDKKK